MGGEFDTSGRSPFIILSQFKLAQLSTGKRGETHCLSRHHKDSKSLVLQPKFL